VYLHDTPSKSLFVKAQRNFSHGCIRVENPFKLAEVVLNDPAQWNETTFKQVIASGKTRTVHLQQPLPVLLLYWTAEAGSDGTVYFMRDIYGRDGKVLAALNAGFKFRRRPILHN
jgi:murein L,D-transpeptidase YcbB/YkuD